MGKNRQKKDDLSKRLKMMEGSSFQGRYVKRIRQQLKYASLGRRFLSFLIDFICSSIFISIIPMLITSIVTQEKSFTIEHMMQLPMMMQMICCILAVVFAIFYFCIYPLSKNHLGQTLGKRLMHIKVECRDGSQVPLNTMLKRELIGSMILEGETAFPSAFVRYMIFLWIPASFAQILTIISIVVSLGSIIFCMIDKNRRMVHDFVANTRVVDL